VAAMGEWSPTWGWKRDSGAVGQRGSRSWRAAICQPGPLDRRMSVWACLVCSRLPADPLSGLTPNCSPSNIYCCSGGAGSGRLSMWGSSPTFFFLLRRCLPTRCWLPFAIMLPSLVSSSWISDGREPFSDPSCRCGWTARTADLARELRPTTVQRSAVLSNAFSNPGRWSGHGMCWRCRRLDGNGPCAGRSIGGGSSDVRCGCAPTRCPVDGDTASGRFSMTSTWFFGVRGEPT
jgi:hypothetical protein